VRRVDTTQLLKGVLDLAVLAVVGREDGYGYDVVRRLRAGGLEDVGDASVYGTLRRLYSAGALTSYVVPSDEGPHRKYYGITPAGRTALADQTRTWLAFADTMQTMLLDPAPTPAPAPPAAPTPTRKLDVTTEVAR
jgi:PadR family transcriptional regulator PadR